MCGIFGFWGSEKIKINKEKLLLANKLLNHRGPDDSGIYINDELNLGLSHNRLSILDLSDAGHQPMLSKEKDVILVYNGEIYNYLEKKIFLEEKGYLLKGNSDTEVLLNLYLYCRDNSKNFQKILGELNGIFAFAIFDLKKKLLFLARDSFGVKPLYYVQNDEYFLFSSEIKVITRLTDELGIKAEDEVNLNALENYLSYLYCPGDNTLLEKIKKVSPGEFLQITNKTDILKYKWFCPPIIENKSSKNDILGFTKTKYIKEATSHIRRAVKRQMLSDVEVGAFLSGGIDSSLIVAFAKEINPNIKCFTIDLIGGNDYGIENDLPYAIKVAKYFDVPLEIIKIDSEKLSKMLPWMIYQLDEPLADPAALNVYFISKLAREKGIKVLLSGAGGDDIFTGYRRHLAINAINIFNIIPFGIRKFLTKSSFNNPNKKFFSKRLIKLFRSFEYEGNEQLVEMFRWISRNDLKNIFSDKTIKSLYEDGFIKDEMLNYLQNNFLKQSSKITKILALEQRYFLADHNLIYTDKMSMAAGVEVRVPFLDKDLVKFASTIPNNFLQSKTQSKWILKKVAEQFLPKEIVYRSKSGFGAPVRKWINLELNELKKDLLSQQSINKRGFFSYQKLTKLLNQNQEDAIDASYTILSIMCIELWCRKFLDVT